MLEQAPTHTSPRTTTRAPHPMPTPPGDAGPPIPSTENPGAELGRSLSPRGPPKPPLLSHTSPAPPVPHPPPARPVWRWRLPRPRRGRHVQRDAPRAHPRRGSTLRPHRPTMGGERACPWRTPLCGGAWYSPGTGVLKGQERREGAGEREGQGWGPGVEGRGPAVTAGVRSGQ